MKNKKLINFYKKELFSKIWQVIIPIIIYLIIFLLLFEEKKENNSIDFYYVYNEQKNFLNFISVIMGLIYGSINYMYIYNKSEYIFYNSLPLKRKQLFLLKFFSSFFMSIIVIIFITIIQYTTIINIKNVNIIPFIREIIANILLFSMIYNLSIFISTLSNSNIVKFLILTILYITPFWLYNTLLDGNNEILKNITYYIFNYNIIYILQNLFIYSNFYINYDYNYFKIILIIFYIIILFIVSYNNFNKIELENSNDILIFENQVNFFKILGEFSIISVVFENLKNLNYSLFAIYRAILIILLLHLFCEYFTTKSLKNIFKLKNLKHLIISIILAFIFILIK